MVHTLIKSIRIRVAHFEGHIRLIKKIPAPYITHAEGLFIDSNDKMYISDRNDSVSVHIINNDRSEVLQLTGYKGVAIGDTVVAPDGTLWVSDYSGGKNLPLLIPVCNSCTFFQY